MCFIFAECSLRFKPTKEVPIKNNAYNVDYFSLVLHKETNGVPIDPEKGQPFKLKFTPRLLILIGKGCSYTNQW